MLTTRRHVVRLLTATLLVAPLLLSHAGCGEDSPEAKQEALGAKGARIYATISGTNEVLVFDDETHAEVERYAVGKGPAIILATPAYDKLYTANWADDTVSAIDTESGEVTNIVMAGKPYVIAIDQAGERVYAGLTTSEIAVIDTASDEVVRSLPMSELPASMIVSPDGGTIYVAYLGLGITPGRLIAVSAETGEEVHGPLPLGLSPAWITISPDGKKVYTLNFLSDDITVIDTASWSVDATVEGGAGTRGIIANVTPDNSRLYVTNHGTSDMIAVDTATNAIVQTIPLNGRPVGVNFSPDGKRVYVTDFGPQSKNEDIQLGYLLTGQYEPSGNGQISVFDVESGAQIGSTIEVGPGATSVVVSSGSAD